MEGKRREGNYQSWVNIDQRSLQPTTKPPGGNINIPKKSFPPQRGTQMKWDIGTLTRGTTISYIRWTTIELNRDVKVDCRSSWIGIEGLPLNLWSIKVMRKIRDMCGSLLDVEKDTAEKTFLHYSSPTSDGSSGSIAKEGQIEKSHDVFIIASVRFEVNCHPKARDVQGFTKPKNSSHVGERPIHLQTVFSQLSCDLNGPCQRLPHDICHFTFTINTWLLGKKRVNGDSYTINSSWALNKLLCQAMEVEYQPILPKQLIKPNHMPLTQPNQILDRLCGPEN
ncbi:hypothetical protein G4B88_007370 [Cannabis sativa]|uniref:DUF4283 domain-containing protein n=1 Tax=Cannabis sativa TaxID=3483 RepID=A0A7J6DNP5_CANSA|nr:hypothetical protein G4B88_007370 [Cannabis sativa]